LFVSDRHCNLASFQSATAANAFVELLATHTTLQILPFSTATTLMSIADITEIDRTFAIRF
jgi:hypothetical protein